MRFPYQSLEVDWHPDRIIYRPMVELTIIGSNGQQKTELVLADTGCDTTMLRDLYVPDLGVVLEEATIVTGIGGQPVPARFGNVELELRRPKEIFHWNARVAFYPGNRDFLGHEGFFDLFIVGFNSHQRQLTIKPNPLAKSSAKVLVIPIS
jgi:hypothetical protein